ncbi:hypothetical protein [Photobacterium lutimaris]|uniref:hypothetical protein n=1 Tax=Photobacterium lutimaris TaxID=388278 RepID=UPI0010EE0945|nr:hypothetical protein [Photobacterium lutimaris]TDR74868.1 putative outer membrane protein [Photobacterium lutimaris]
MKQIKLLTIAMIAVLPTVSQAQVVSNYNHSFGMKSNQGHIDEDSLSAGLNYRFN